MEETPPPHSSQHQDRLGQIARVGWTADLIVDHTQLPRGLPGPLLARQAKRLRNIDVHDIICKIGEVVVMGGVRRSALISLSDLVEIYVSGR